MKNSVFTCIAIIFYLCSCQKAADTILKNEPSTDASGFVLHTIKAGQHFSDKNAYRSIELSELKFTVRFDSSAIYRSRNPANQYDINKLYGFSDNDSAHHSYSARFGWRWSGNALRLFAYIYNRGEVMSKELGTIAIGAEVPCSIQATTSSYLFTVNGITERLPRMSSTPKAKGYKLYPYFGGDEAAPHDVTIYIRDNSNQ
jgi:hypothetical protein